MAQLKDLIVNGKSRFLDNVNVTGTVTATALVKSGGTAGQLLRADGTTTTSIAYAATSSYASTTSYAATSSTAGYASTAAYAGTASYYPSITITVAGTGSAVTTASATGHSITLTKGAFFASESHSHSLTISAGSGNVVSGITGTFTTNGLTLTISKTNVATTNSANLKVLNTTTKSIGNNESSGSYVKFEGGTNKFKVIDGVTANSSFEVSITPSISQNVTYTNSITSGQVAIFEGTSGVIKSSGYTIAKNVPSTALFTDTTYSAGDGITLSNNTYKHTNAITAGTAGTSSATSGSTIAIPYIVFDAQGHITGQGTHTHTITGFSTTDHTHDTRYVRKDTNTELNNGVSTTWVTYGTRKITITGNSIGLDMSAETGGWAGNMVALTDYQSVTVSENTSVWQKRTHTAFGFFGSKNSESNKAALNYFYMGSKYNDPIVKIYPSTTPQPWNMVERFEVLKSADIIPQANNTYNLGTTSKKWKNLYVNNINGASVPATPAFTDTTYTLSAGDNNGQVKLIPSTGSAINVTVSGLSDAAYKGVDITVTATSRNLPDSSAVVAYVSSQMTSVLTYKGVVSNTVSLPTTHKQGDVYVVKTAGKYADVSCEPGDYIICNSTNLTTDAAWDVISGENQIVFNNVTLANAGSSVSFVTGEGSQYYITTPSGWKLTDTDEKQKVTSTTGTIYISGVAALTTSPQVGYGNANAYISNGYVYSGGTKVSVEGHTHSYADAEHSHTASGINGVATNVTAINIYAPTSSGTSGYILKSNGSNSAPTWTSASLTDTTYSPGTDLTVSGSGTSYTFNHKSSGIAAGTYGSGTQIPVISVSATGHVTSASFITHSHTSVTLASAGNSVTFATIGSTGYSITTPSNWKVTDTDEKVKQSTTTTNAFYPILGAYTSSPTSNTAGQSYYNANIAINAAANTIKVNACQMTYDTTEQCMKFIFS